MDNSAIKEAIAEGIKEAFDNQPDPIVCSLGLDRDEHAKEHEFISSLMGMSRRLDNIKWGLLGSVIKTTGTIALGLIVLGAIAYAKVELKKISG